MPDGVLGAVGWWCGVPCGAWLKSNRRMVMGGYREASNEYRWRGQLVTLRRCGAFVNCPADSFGPGWWEPRLRSAAVFPFFVALRGVPAGRGAPHEVGAGGETSPTSYF